jgi:hypothetical protein
MRIRIGAALASVATVAAVLLVWGGSAVSSATTPSRGAREDCSTRSEANFPGGFTDRRNLVVGPLVLVGGTYTSARTVRQFGGNKFPLLVEAGHTVTVRLARSARRVAGLAYGPLPEGEVRLRDTHQAVTFVACRPSGPSGSHAGAIAVTFWSGFVLARAPMCVALEVYVDREPSPRRVGLSLGRRCASKR